MTPAVSPRRSWNVKRRPRRPRVLPVVSRRRATPTTGPKSISLVGRPVSPDFCAFSAIFPAPRVPGRWPWRRKPCARTVGDAGAGCARNPSLAPGRCLPCTERPSRCCTSGALPPRPYRGRNAVQGRQRSGTMQSQCRHLPRAPNLPRGCSSSCCRRRRTLTPSWQWVSNYRDSRRDGNAGFLRYPFLRPDCARKIDIFVCDFANRFVLSIETRKQLGIVTFCRYCFLEILLCVVK